MKKKPVKKKKGPVRKTAGRSVRKPAGKVKAGKSVRKAQDKPIGDVKHFYTGIKVAIVKFKLPVKAGSSVRFKGATTDFAQKLESMQFDHEPVRLAKKGKLIGVRVKKRVREGDSIYRV